MANFIFIHNGNEIRCSRITDVEYYLDSVGIYTTSIAHDGNRLVCETINEYGRIGEVVLKLIPDFRSGFLSEHDEYSLDRQMVGKKYVKIHIRHNDGKRRCRI